MASTKTLKVAMYSRHSPLASTAKSILVLDAVCGVVMVLHGVDSAPSLQCHFPAEGKQSSSHQQTLHEYARQMLALRDEAWAEMVRPEIRGRVRIGMPDDYASSLLPPVLRKFSVTYPRVEIQVVGRPSHELALQIKDNTLDLACITRTKGCPGEFIRLEPMVWVGSAASRPIWKERPLPIAVFAEGSVARANAIKALQGASIPYRMSYESPSIQGLVSMVDAGLAIAPLARCGVPAHLIQLGVADGLPRLAELEMVLARSAQSTRPPCDFLAELIFQELRY
ncbi:LysR substrate-binding domain-containing protein [Vogesella indigofera]|uniref:LysR substrate-binding domain-containing protein n=1 Tax=Vogesella indigofera TaxID=45465 RepID=UPI00234F2D5D|nr:LysR substrate-binding domain-containing protein [Vogesella indigofera]MDC7696221.1 LysR substrate-binding domain-containing protein [Vogesella indigofera]